MTVADPCQGRARRRTQSSFSSFFAADKSWRKGERSSSIRVYWRAVAKRDDNSVKKAGRIAQLAVCENLLAWRWWARTSPKPSRNSATKPKLLLATDLGTLKAYRLEFTLQDTPRLEELETAVLEDAHTRVSDTVTDLAGRRATPTQKNWSATLGDDHNLELESRRRLIRQLASHIERLVQGRDYQSCWLAAPKEIAHQVLDELSQSARNRIKRMIPCDLTKATPKELLDQFLNPSFWTVPTWMRMRIPPSQGRVSGRRRIYGSEES
jgi:Protein required for attachment to host cells.